MNHFENGQAKALEAIQNKARIVGIKLENVRKFESYTEASRDAKRNGYRELSDGEDFGDMTYAQQAKIADVHSSGDGMWTWSKKSDMRD